MLIVTGTIAVPPADLADFVAELAELAVATRRRDGNLSYDAAVLDAAAGRLLVTEQWCDQGALSAYLAAADTTAFAARWQDRLESDVRLFDAGNERPLAALVPPVGADTRFLDVDGGRIAYDDTGGDGPLVLAIPGMGDLRGEYRHLRPSLVAAGLRVVTMDVRGFGETSARWDDYSARAVGGDALALIEALGAETAVILGNSFAAGSALWAAREAPDRVGGVVLLGPLVRDLPLSPQLMIAFQVGLAGPWREDFWIAYWDALFPTRKPADHEDYKTSLRANLAEPGRMEALLAMLSLPKADTAAIVDDNRVPALVVMGSRDPDFEDAAGEAAWLAGQLGGRQVVIDGAGHYPHTEMPDLVVPAILSFVLDPHRASGRPLAFV